MTDTERLITTIWFEEDNKDFLDLHKAKRSKIVQLKFNITLKENNKPSPLKFSAALMTVEKTRPNDTSLTILANYADISRMCTRIRSYWKFYDVTIDSQIIRDWFDGNNLNLSDPEVDPDVTTNIKAQIIQTSKKIPLVIGFTQKFNRAMVYVILEQEKYTPKAQASGLTDNAISTMMSLYLGTLLAFLSEDDYEDVIKSLRERIESGHVLLTNLNPATIRDLKHKQVSIPLDKAMVYGFLGGASLCKTGADPDHLKQWAHKRISALLVKREQTLKYDTINFAYDLMVIGRYMESNSDIRSKILMPFLREKPLNDGNTGIGSVKDALKIVLANYELRTFMMAKRFAENGKTGAHQLGEICSQSIDILNAYDDLKNAHDTKFENDTINYRFEYYCVFNEHPEIANISRYPDLVYCAVKENKLYFGDTWKNYIVTGLNTKLDTAKLLESLTYTLTSDVDPNADVDPNIKRYLARVGRSPNQKLEKRSMPQYMMGGPTII